MHDVSIAILAGGKSRRMGQNKSFVPLDGKPLIDHTLDQLKILKLSIFIVTNTPEVYTQCGLPTVRDILPDHGAMGGIYTALQSSSTSHVLCAACDMPFLKPALLRLFLQYRMGYDGVVARMDGIWQVFPGVYGRTCLDILEGCLQRQQFHLQTVLSTLPIYSPQIDEMRIHDPDLQTFNNINTPAELARYTEQIVKR